MSSSRFRRMSTLTGKITSGVVCTTSTTSAISRCVIATAANMAPKLVEIPQPI
ncbi:hypothetical protein D3C83_172870 [compost metagenome]